MIGRQTVYHDSLEEKVINIVQEMEQFEETYNEEKEALMKTFPQKSNEVFEFTKIKEEKVLKIQKSVPSNTSCGDDEISYLELRDAAFYIAGHLKQIVNLIIETNHWSSQWKNSIIKPLYKG